MLSLKALKASLKEFSTLNSICSKLGSNSPLDVALSWVQSQCLPVINCDICSATLNLSEVSNFSFAFNCTFIKLLNSTDVNNINFCQYYCGFLKFQLIYEYHRLNFLAKLIKDCQLSSTFTVDACDWSEFIQLSAKFKVLLSDSKYCVKRKMWTFFKSEILK